MGESVVVVESPAKAKTLERYLGSGFTVLASYGHVRDLPAKDGSVRPDDDFAMTYAIEARAAKHLAAIAKAVKGSDNLYLATDPDREGEAISWHIAEALAERRALQGVSVRRVAFHEITKGAVRDAMQRPRDLDMDLINAQQARRALDYLVGFTLSPVLWRKLPGSRSAGRVQSVALRLVCQRESEIEAFTAREYWTVETDFRTAAGDGFTARLTHLNGDKLGKFDLANVTTATAAAAAIVAREFAVAAVEAKQTRRHPAPPFTTSTLQQEAARKLGFGAKRTMQVAQRLYEGTNLGGEIVGLITYMRTDSVNLAREAVTACRRMIGAAYGTPYLPDAPRAYRSPSKNAQEAHEAIRPTAFDRRPKDVARHLDADQRRLYELVWKRAVASQMESALVDRVTADIASPDARVTLRATGSRIAFDGFLKIYREGRDDAAADDDDNRMLPRLAKDDALARGETRPEQHFTEPPPRFTEATLVKRLEELGIGRPSTYASILSVLQDRDYVRLEMKRFIPEDRGRLVTAFLESFFGRYVEYDFTANLEDKLDDISNGRIEWKAVLRDFWGPFIAEVDETRELRVADVLSALDSVLGPHIFAGDGSGRDPRACPSCADGRLNLKLGKFGAFVGCANYPECRYHAALRRHWREGRWHRRPWTHRIGQRSGNGPPRYGAQGAVRPLRAARRSDRGGKTQTRHAAQGVRARRRRFRDRAGPSVAPPQARRASRERRADQRRHRPVRPLPQARQGIRFAAGGGRRAGHRPQPRGHADRRGQGRTARFRAATGDRRASPRRRGGARDGRALRPLSAAQRHQRSAAQDHLARDDHHRPGRRPARRARQGAQGAAPNLHEKGARCEEGARRQEEAHHKAETRREEEAPGGRGGGQMSGTAQVALG